MKFNDIFNLEVLKFAFKFRAKIFPSCFHDYFLQAEQTHSYSTRFTTDENWPLMRCNKQITQRSIRYCKLPYLELSTRDKKREPVKYANTYKKLEIFLTIDNLDILLFPTLFCVNYLCPNNYIYAIYCVRLSLFQLIIWFL